MKCSAVGVDLPYDAPTAHHHERARQQGVKGVEVESGGAVSHVALEGVHVVAKVALCVLVEI